MTPKITYKLRFSRPNGGWCYHVARHKPCNLSTQQFALDFIELCKAAGAKECLPSEYSGEIVVKLKPSKDGCCSIMTDYRMSKYSSTEDKEHILDLYNSIIDRKA